MPADSIDDRSESDDFGLPTDASKYVEVSTFEQILEMDDDSAREFSRQLVFGFFEQAEGTFKEMDDFIEEKDLEALSSRGHFLKGSSATLGLFKVRDSCEKIQHWGDGKEEDGVKELKDQDKALKYIKDIMPIMKKDYEEVEKWLKEFYGPDPEEDEEEEKEKDKEKE